MEITKDILKNTLFFNDDLYWTGNVVEIDKKNRLKKCIDWNQCNKEQNKHIFEIVSLKNARANKFYVEIKLNPFIIKPGKVFKDIQDEDQNIDDWRIKNHDLINLGKISKTTHYKDNFYFAMTQKYGKEYIDKGLEYFKNKKQEFSNPTTPEEKKKLNKISCLESEFNYTTKNCNKFFKDKEEINNFNPMLDKEDLIGNILYYDKDFYWTGNVASISTNEGIKVEKLDGDFVDDHIEALFEFDHTYNNNTEKVYVDLLVNPYGISAGDIYSNKEHLQGTLLNNEKAKEKKNSLTKQLLNCFKKENNKVYNNGILPKDILTILDENLNYSMYNKYGDIYCKKALDYYHKERKLINHAYTEEQAEIALDSLDTQQNVFNRTIMQEKIDNDLFLEIISNRNLNARLDSLEEYKKSEEYKILLLHD